MHLPTTPYPRFHLAFPGDRPRGGAPLLRRVPRLPRRSQLARTGSTSTSSATRSSRTRSPRSEMTDATSLVDGQDVPVRHFGVVLDLATWERLAARFKAAGIDVRHRAVRALQGRAGRAGDDVLPRPVRQRARVQGVRRHEPAVRDLTRSRVRIVITEFMDEAGGRARSRARTTTLLRPGPRRPARRARGRGSPAPTR